jgi:inositol hexakisphosphate/diphosphoinositol-pentakisphosphate kinase
MDRSESGDAKETSNPSSPQASPDSENFSTTSLRTKSRAAPHSLSSSSATRSTTNRKGRADVGSVSDAHSERASISMPPPGPASRRASSQSVRSVNSRASSITGGTDGWRPGLERKASGDDFGVEDTPKISAGNMGTKEDPTYQLPEAALRARPSIPEFETKRMSVSSMYSLSSARAGGAPSSAASANGSEVGTGSNTRTPAGPLSPSKSAHPETSTTTISVTTSTSGQVGGHGAPNGHQLTPRDTPIPCLRNCKTKRGTTW